jgi:hypothetical protein
LLETATTRKPKSQLMGKGPTATVDVIERPVTGSRGPAPNLPRDGHGHDGVAQQRQHDRASNADRKGAQEQQL